jgi:hypothetical protein
MVKEPKTINHFLGHFLKNVFTIINYYFSCLSIACSNIWLEIYLRIKNSGNSLKFIFLIQMAP